MALASSGAAPFRMARSDSAFCAGLVWVRDRMSLTAANWASWRATTTSPTVFFRIRRGRVLPAVSPEETRRGFSQTALVVLAADRVVTGLAEGLAVGAAPLARGRPAGAPALVDLVGAPGLVDAELDGRGVRR